MAERVIVDPYSTRDETGSTEPPSPAVTVTLNSCFTKFATNTVSAVIASLVKFASALTSVPATVQFTNS